MKLERTNILTILGVLIYEHGIFLLQLYLAISFFGAVLNDSLKLKIPAVHCRHIGKQISHMYLFLYILSNFIHKQSHHIWIKIVLFLPFQSLWLLSPGIIILSRTLWCQTNSERIHTFLVGYLRNCPVYAHQIWDVFYRFFLSSWGGL